MTSTIETTEDIAIEDGEMEVAVPVATWAMVNSLTAQGDKQVNRMWYSHNRFSDSGYETASSNDDYVHSSEPRLLRWKWNNEDYGTSYAFRLWKMDAVGQVVYTPFIPAGHDYQEAERQAMRAYFNLLQTGKLPKVHADGTLAK